MTFLRRLFLLCLTVPVLATLLTGASASPGLANEPVLLHLRGEQGSEIALTRAALEGLPQRRFTTDTIWTQGRIEFSGPSLKSVLRLANIRSGPVRLQALNEYEITLDADTLTDDYPIIATRRDGVPFGVRDSGPLWLVYPFERGGPLATELTYASSIWQLILIEGGP